MPRWALRLLGGPAAGDPAKFIGPPSWNLVLACSETSLTLDLQRRCSRLPSSLQLRLLQPPWCPPLPDSVLDFDLCTPRGPCNIETLQGSWSTLIMCYKRKLPNIKMRYKGFKMKLRTQPYHSKLVLKHHGLLDLSYKSFNCNVV